MKKFLILIVSLLVIGVLVVWLMERKEVTPSVVNESSTKQSEQVQYDTYPVDTSIVEPSPFNGESIQTPQPLSRAGERITKKLFGTHVTPKDSPVSPERFTGYHTGVDFEVFPEEENIDVPVRVICTGPVVRKQFGSGYGGVAAQRCTISDEPVLVVYGHLKLESITTAINQELKIGDTIGILGKGYSAETDGERKHLHLSIHKGTNIVLSGYVATQTQLSAWLDPKVVLGL